MDTLPGTGAGGGLDPMVVSFCLALGVAAVAAIGDARTRRIPNGLTVPALVLGLALGLWPADPIGVGGRALGALVAFAPCWLLFRAGALGGGDVKLFAALGALVGVSAAGPLLVHSFVGGALVALGWVALRGELGALARDVVAMLHALRAGDAPSAQALAPKQSLPLGPAIALGLAWTAWSLVA